MKSRSLFSLAFFAVLSGCSTAEPPGSSDVPEGEESFRITTTILPRYTSYIELDPQKERYRYGDTVRVTALGGGRFSFEDWVDGIPPGASNPFPDFVVTSDTVIAASFKPGYLSDRPLLSPRNQVFYPDHPRDLYFMVHENRHPLLSINRDGKPVAYDVEEMSDLPETRELPDSRLIKIPHERVRAFGAGKHTLEFTFGTPGRRDHTGSVLAVEIDVKQDAFSHGAGRYTDMNIISFYVDHGDAVFIDLPNGETLMIDTGTRQNNERYVVPFLKRHLPKIEAGNQRIDHIFITHWHYDHFQGLGSLLEHFDIGSVRYNLAAPPNYYGDYDDFDDPDDPYGFGIDPDGNTTRFRPVHSEDFFVGNQLELGGAEITILNAARHPDNDTWNFIDYVHRNERSLSIRLEHNGFVYSAGGDTYQRAQGAMLSHFDPGFLRSHVFHANHHFHGGIAGEYLLATEPVLFLTSANAAVYDRDAYARVVLNEVIPELEKTSDRFIENLLSFETGITVIRVDTGADWSDPATPLHYETWFMNSLYDFEYQVPYLWE